MMSVYGVKFKMNRIELLFNASLERSFDINSDQVFRGNTEDYSDYSFK